MFDFDKVKEAIDELTRCEMIALWNEYCDANNYYDDRIEYNDIDELCCGLCPSDVINAIDLDNYNLNDDFAVDSIYGWRSFNYVDDEKSPFDINGLAKYIVNSEEHFGYLDDDEITDKSRFTDFDVDLLADEISAEDIKEICDRNGWEYDIEDEDSILESFTDALYTIVQDEDEEHLREHLIRVLCPTVDEETIEECAEY